mgnify:CR=1 FL=1
MALIRPILYSVSAFDATNSQIFNFNVAGGDQVVKNRLVISKQSDNTIVYDNIQTTFAFRHIVPENTLINGEYYSAYIVTYNSLDEASDPSLGIQFYCFTTPSFAFSNIPISSVINNSSYNFIVTYTQNELEHLKSYTFNLYNSERVLLATSDIQYISTTPTLPLNINYTFNGLNDKETYYIEANGQTMHGMIVDTGFILFSVQYEVPNVFSITTVALPSQSPALSKYTIRLPNVFSMFALLKDMLFTYFTELPNTTSHLNVSSSPVCSSTMLVP